MNNKDLVIVKKLSDFLKSCMLKEIAKTRCLRWSLLTLRLLRNSGHSREVVFRAVVFSSLVTQFFDINKFISTHICLLPLKSQISVNLSFKYSVLLHFEESPHVRPPRVRKKHIWSYACVCV